MGTTSTCLKKGYQTLHVIRKVIILCKSAWMTLKSGKSADPPCLVPTQLPTEFDHDLVECQVLCQVIPSYLLSYSELLAKLFQSMVLSFPNCWVGYLGKSLPSGCHVESFPSLSLTSLVWSLAMIEQLLELENNNWLNLH